MKTLKQNFSVFSIVFILFTLLTAISFLFSQSQKIKQIEKKSVPNQEQIVSIEGVVTDEENNPLPNVKIVLISPVLTEEPVTKTNIGGRFKLLNLPPGNYSISFSRPEFWTLTKKIIIQPGLTRSLEIKMKKSSVEEEVNVIPVDPVGGQTKWVTFKYVKNMEAVLAEADDINAEKIESHEESIIKLQNIAEELSGEIKMIKDSIEDLKKDIEKIYKILKAIEEKIK